MISTVTIFNKWEVLKQLLSDFINVFNELCVKWQFRNTWCDFEVSVKNTRRLFPRIPSIMKMKDEIVMQIHLRWIQPSSAGTLQYVQYFTLSNYAVTYTQRIKTLKIVVVLSRICAYWIMCADESRTFQKALICTL